MDSEKAYKCVIDVIFQIPYDRETPKEKESSWVCLSLQSLEQNG